MAFARLLFGLVVACLVLPIAILVVIAVSRMLSAMGDLGGAAVLDRLALAGGILWIILLVCLLLAQAIHALGRGDDETGRPEN